MIELDEKKRIIQEFVPGKQVTLAHVIANPTEDLYLKLGLIDASGAIGIFTITPSEAAMIAADVATKSANVSIGFVDRFNGSLVITGDVAAVQSALTEVMNTLCGMMGFASAPITKTGSNREKKTHYPDRPLHGRQDNALPADQPRGTAVPQDPDRTDCQPEYD